MNSFNPRDQSENPEGQVSKIHSLWKTAESGIKTITPILLADVGEFLLVTSRHQYRETVTNITVPNIL